MKRILFIGLVLGLLGCGDSVTKKGSSKANNANNANNVNNVNNTNLNNVNNVNNVNNTNLNNVNNVNNTNLNNVNNTNLNNVNNVNNTNNVAVGDLHVQLTWNTDMSDMDVHVVHPDAFDGTKPDVDMDGQGDPWFHSTFDCNWRNPEPDWGVAGDLNNPRQDIDDTDGFGPENINLAAMEPVTYRVAAQYYADNFASDTEATVRIYLSGTLVEEFVSPPLAKGDLWEVATIDGATGTVTTVTSDDRGPKIVSNYPTGDAF